MGGLRRDDRLGVHALSELGFLFLAAAKCPKRGSRRRPKLGMGCDCDPAASQFSVSLWRLV